LAKVDKSQYTKDEWRRIKEQRRLEKDQERFEKKMQSQEDLVSFHPAQPSNKYYVLCLKHGTKYSADYVNKLYNMVERNCTLNYEFVCLTDDSRDINKNIKIITLPKELSGWWCKPYMFSDDLGLNGTILYMDLDVVIASNIDHLFTYYPNDWCIIRDFTRKMRPSWQKYNSSVIKFNSGQLSQYWNKFKKSHKDIERKFFGDQDWLYDATHKDNPARLFPDNWIMSWKWEIRSDRVLRPGTRGSRKLRTIEHVVPPQGCCITVFHGDPNPEHCEDPWVVKNWK